MQRNQSDAVCRGRLAVARRHPAVQLPSFRAGGGVEHSTRRQPTRSWAYSSSAPAHRVALTTATWVRVHPAEPGLSAHSGLTSSARTTMGSGLPGGTRSWGREQECALLDELVSTVRRGESRSLVLRGEAGIGKTALLEYLVDSAADLSIVRATGIESEMELAFAGLHQLCAPLLGRLDRLPAPQRDALRIVFGLTAGPAPDRFLVGLAALSLVSEAAEQRPLLCVVDDAQWLDQTSALTLAFVARRLLAEPVGLVFAAREPGEELQHVPTLEVRGLVNGDARALLNSTVPFALDERVRDRILAETRGNPLALVELPRGLTPTQLAGGFGIPEARDLSKRIEISYARRLTTLPEHARHLLLVAAAEPVGDPLLLRGACDRLEIALSAVDATDGLLAVDERVTFRHPLARSAVYRSAGGPERRAAHLALAQVTDRDADPDRRAWHLAAAAAGPDEEVAHELELSAGRAKARGGQAAAAAFLQRAVALTGDPARRAGRALEAAQANLGAGAFDVARRLLAIAEAGPLDELGRARIDLLRAEIVFAAAPRWRRPAPAAPGGEEARAARRTPRSQHVSRCVGRGAVRRPPGQRRRHAARRLACRGERPRSGGPCPSTRPAARRPCADLRRGDACCDTSAAARDRRVQGQRGLRGGGAPVGLAGGTGGDLVVGLRERPRDPSARGPAGARLRGARGPRRGGQRVRSGRCVGRRLRARRPAGGGGRNRQGGDGEPHRPLRRDLARGTPRPGSRGLAADRGRHQRSRRQPTRDRRAVRALGERRPHERPRSLRGGHRGGCRRRSRARRSSSSPRGPWAS